MVIEIILFFIAILLLILLGLAWPVCERWMHQREYAAFLRRQRFLKEADDIDPVQKLRRMTGFNRPNRSKRNEQG